MGGKNRDAVTGAGRLMDRFRARLRAEALRVRDFEYLDYVRAIGEPDLDSTILVEIPSYNDPEVVRTVQAATAMAANPARIKFAICLQDDDRDRLEALRAMPGTCVKHYALRDAPGACAARYECNMMYAGEDFVFHTDAHMRFARFWDVAAIDQWKLCGNDKAVLTEYARPFGADLLARPVDDMAFTRLASLEGRLLTALFFPKHEPGASLRTGLVAFRGPVPRLGAFIAAGYLFCRGSVDEQVPVDPKMHFFGDEMGMCVRYWTHGCDIYQPGAELVFHLYAGERHNAGYRDEGVLRKRAKEVMTEDGISRGERERRRMEKLYGIYDWPGVGLGAFGLGAERSLAEYQEFCGVDFRRMRIRNFAKKGLFGQAHTDPEDMAFHDWEAAYDKQPHAPVADRELNVKIDGGVAGRFREFCSRDGWHAPAALTEALRTWMDENDDGQGPAAGGQAHRDGDARKRFDRFRAEVRAEGLRIPGSKYLEYVAGIRRPDLTSTILIEIPAYLDPELMNTVDAARAMAANPDRIKFAVCLQDDDPGKLEALYGIPGCRVKYYTSDEAPGLCAARYECQKLYGGEDFVFHIDSHMRFARFWDVAMIAQWRACGDERAVLSDYCRRIDAGWTGLPVGDATFTRAVEMCCGVVNVSFIANDVPELRFRVPRLYASDRPVLGAFVSGHCLFGRPLIDKLVPSDPQMDFVADEHSVAARLWTSGFDIYHGNVRCVLHLYNRNAVAGTTFARPADSTPASGGISRWERQTRRLEKLFGVYDRQDVDLSGFDLGTERTLAAYQAFCGVDFRNLTVRSFAVNGRFDTEHGPEDLKRFDWAKAYKARGGKLPDKGRKLDVGIRPDAAEEFLKICAEMGLRPQAALTEAVRQWTDNKLRGRS